MQIPTLRRSKFTINRINTKQWISEMYYGKKPWKNCFINPKGDIIPITDEWHHIEVALRIIKEYDKQRKSYISNLNRGIKDFQERINKRSSNEDNCKYYNGRIAELKKELATALKPDVEDTFKAVNRNRGFDAGEFLVIYMGYVAISDFHPMYHEVTHKQAEVLNCYIGDDGVLIPMDEKEVIYRDKRNELKDEVRSIIHNIAYYSDTTNAFHCPSGCPRMGWEKAKHQFEQDQLPKLRSPKFLDELKKYNLKIPEYSFGWSFYKKTVTIKEETFNIK